MKKGAPFEWDDACENTFDSIKRCLSSLPILGVPIPTKALLLSIAAKERSLGALCAQENSKVKERAFYYLSRTLVGVELNYSPIKKTCLALMFAVQKLRHYIQARTVYVISKANSFKYILSRPTLHGRLTKWAVILEQYDLVLVSQRPVKGQPLAYFQVDHPVPDDWELNDDQPVEEVYFINVLPPWEMFFDGAARRDGAGAGVALVSSEKHILP